VKVLGIVINFIKKSEVKVNQVKRSLALPLGTMFGIPIRVHATLLLLFVWVATQASQANANIVRELLLVTLLLACVLLHEIGHALAAKRFGISTRDIVLYPFGGIASIQGSPKPFAELIIAIAGPAVNVIIAFLLAFFFTIPEDANLILASEDVVPRLLVANVFLVVFNLIPALPMDGGRVLRAALALAGIRSATAMSARLSQLISLLMAGYALYIFSPILLLIALLIFSQATSEHMHDKAQRLATGVLAKEAMVDSKHLICFPHGTTIEAAFHLAAKTTQPAFPVLHGETLVGLLDRQLLIEAGATTSENQYVAELIDRNIPLLNAQTPLTQLINDPTFQQYETIAVVDQNIFAGLLFRERVLEFLLLKGLRAEHKVLMQNFSDDAV
jgi:Zn-dependent protease